MESVVNEERILKKVHTIATVVAGLFFVLIIGVICQFAVINYNNRRQEEIQALTALREKWAEEQEQDKVYYNSDDFRRETLVNAGYTEDGSKKQS
jgi:hypothetical protein